MASSADRVLEHLGAEPADRAGLGQRLGSSGSLVVTPSRRASASKVVPWSSVETNTAKNTMLRNSRPSRSRPALIGKIASTIGTAPRKPAQPSTTFSFTEKASNGERDEGRERASDEHDHEREHGALDGDVHQVVREDQQAERQEHGQLGHPREARRGSP